MLWLLLSITLSYIVRPALSCDVNSSASALSLKDILPPNYDKMVPPANGEPVIVKVKVAILNIRSVDEEKQAIEANIFFHQYWRDSRIKMPSHCGNHRLVLDNRWRNDIWIPDTYFKNSISGSVHTIIIPYTYLVLSNNSELFLAARIAVTFNCEMNLAAYPHDVQECDVQIMSLLYTVETVILEWKEFLVTSKIFLAQFNVKEVSNNSCNRSYDIGTFSCLSGNVKLARRLGFFLINRFVPSILIVVMSFVTFWIPATAYPARVTLGVTSLLTIVTQQYHQTKFSVSYVMALNVWMLSCIAFVFFSLLEYALVISFMDKQKQTASPVDASDKEDHGRRMWNGPSFVQISHAKIDKISRIAFPIAFLINCVVYWAVFAR